MDVIRFFQAAFALAIASGMVKFGNQNYEMLKTEFSILVPVACLIGGIALAIYGIRTFIRSFSYA